MYKNDDSNKTSRAEWDQSFLNPELHKMHEQLQQYMKEIEIESLNPDESPKMDQLLDDSQELIKKMSKFIKKNELMNKILPISGEQKTGTEIINDAIERLNGLVTRKEGIEEIRSINMHSDDNNSMDLNKRSQAGQNQRFIDSELHKMTGELEGIIKKTEVDSLSPGRSSVAIDWLLDEAQKLLTEMSSFMKENRLMNKLILMPEGPKMGAEIINDLAEGLKNPIIIKEGVEAIRGMGALMQKSLDYSVELEESTDYATRSTPKNRNISPVRALFSRLLSFANKILSRGKTNEYSNFYGKGESLIDNDEDQNLEHETIEAAVALSMSPRQNRGSKNSKVVIKTEPIPDLDRNGPETTEPSMVQRHPRPPTSPKIRDKPKPPKKKGRLTKGDIGRPTPILVEEKTEAVIKPEPTPKLNTKEARDEIIKSLSGRPRPQPGGNIKPHSTPNLSEGESKANASAPPVPPRQQPGSFIRTQSAPAISGTVISVREVEANIAPPVPPRPVKTKSTPNLKGEGVVTNIAPPLPSRPSPQKPTRVAPPPPILEENKTPPSLVKTEPMPGLDNTEEKIKPTAIKKPVPVPRQKLKGQSSEIKDRQVSKTLDEANVYQERGKTRS